MKKLFTLIFTALIIVSYPAFSQNEFSRGVNLTGWFQSGSVRGVQFSKYSRQDFVNIKSLGCDVVRLPINLHFMTSGSPDYTIDPLFYSMMDSVAGWAEELHINLILDNHTFDPAVNTDPSVGSILVKVWSQMAAHYKDHSNYIKYEVLNEPHGLTTQVWGSIQQTVIDAIRAVDEKHSIVVGAAGWNTYNEMSLLPQYSDTNLIYTFHFYDPFLFTHQGASWASPSMVDLAGVPFPYNAASMPACPASLKGSWIENEIKYNYASNGTLANIKNLINIAVTFRDTRKVKIYCGEFGVYNLNSPPADRVTWYSDVSTYLNSKNIPWTTWDYQGGFGLFIKGSNELFNHDLNVPLIQALGLNIPAQTVYMQRPDSIGFSIYSDFVGSYINENSNISGLDFYCAQHPNNGNYCMDWHGGVQYSTISFQFKPSRDLSLLVKNNYALDLLVRGDSPGSSFDLRFIDTKTSNPNDHPWRMNHRVTSGTVPYDKKWHHLRIPLNSFTEMGSWDNNSWYNPEGLFDWTAVDQFDIVAEEADLTGKQFWYDNIIISDLDTSAIWDSSILNTHLISESDSAGILNLFPNPVKEYFQASFFLLNPANVKVRMLDLTGRVMFSSEMKSLNAGPHSFLWKRGESGFADLSPGLYFLNILIPGVSSLSRSFVME